MTVLDQLRIQRVVAIGDGAGGNIVIRYENTQILNQVSNKLIDLVCFIRVAFMELF